VPASRRTSPNQGNGGEQQQQGKWKGRIKEELGVKAGWALKTKLIRMKEKRDKRSSSIVDALVKNNFH